MKKYLNTISVIGGGISGAFNIAMNGLYPNGNNNLQSDGKGGVTLNTNVYNNNQIFKSIASEYNYIRPDPNPTGKGEGYINTIAPGNEWMLSNCTHGNEWIYIDNNGYFFDYNA